MAGARARRTETGESRARTRQPAKSGQGSRTTSLKAPTRARRGGQGTGAKGKGGGGASRRWGWRIARWLATLCVWGVIALVGVLGALAWDLPDIADLDKATSRAPQAHILAEDGTPIAAFGDLYGQPVRLRDLPPYVPAAVIAIEDRRFAYHFGVDPIGIARAAVTNLLAGGVRQGGSTLTQQLAKTLFLTPDRTLTRKAREAMLALWLEWRFSKDQILEIYLNRVYLGAGAYGVDAAARRYFGLPATRLSLTQAAAIAGMPKAPSRLNPYADPKATAERAGLVLDAMVETGAISAAEARAARRDRIPPEAPRATGSNGRWFADWALGRATGMLGGLNGDLVVRTTLDPVLQRILEQEAAALFPAMDAKRADQLAAVLIAPDGAVKAMLGGRSWTQSPFNRAVQGARQPGSAFKTLVYLAALGAGVSPESRFEDAPVRIGDWRPENFEGRYRGPISFREGVAHSSNAMAITLLEQVGRARVVELARRLGVTARLEPTPALALGAYEMTPLELAGVFASLANGGYAVSPRAVTRIEDAAGRLIHAPAVEEAQVIADPITIAALHDVLRGVISDGTGRAAALSGGRPAAGKTGTSQDYRDAWFAGYTAELALVIWMGNDDAAPTDRLTGGGLPAELFKRVMDKALAATPPRPLTGAIR